MISRRGFLSFLGAAAVAAIDPDRLLWVPSRLISIPTPRKVRIGHVINVRRPPRFISTDGLAFKPQPLFDTHVSIVVNSDHLKRYTDNEILTGDIYVREVLAQFKSELVMRNFDKEFSLA